MIDASYLQEVVNFHIDKLRRFMCLHDWALNIKIYPIENKKAANCFPDINYKKAQLTFDPAGFDPGDEELILDLCFHEMCHVLAAPYDMFVEAVAKSIDNDTAYSQVLKAINTTAGEHFVINMEQMWRVWMKQAYMEYIENVQP